MHPVENTSFISPSIAASSTSHSDCTENTISNSSSIACVTVAAVAKEQVYLPQSLE
jgi:hypothetical protein